MGLLFVTKMSAALMIPVAVALAGIRVWYGRPLIWRGARPRRVVGRGRQLTIVAAILAAHAAAVLLVIWASYGCRYATFAESMPGRDRMFLGETVDTLAAPDVVGTVIIAARNLRVLPETYLFGAAHVLNRSGRLPAFLNGRYSIDGWWYFFPYCWLVKTPLPVFGLFAAAALVTGLAACSRPRILRRTIYGATPLIVFLAVYWTAAMSSSLNLGERHLLPAYPAMFILAGGAGYRPAHRHRAIVLSVVLLLALLAVESVRIWPSYLAYFSGLAGGPAQGYRHLVDSSLDWGQDLPALRQWLERRRREGLRSSVYLSYFGSGDPAHYGMDVRQIFSYQDWRAEPPLYDLAGGIYCISATMLQSVYTLARGPWAVQYQQRYQRMRQAIEAHRTADRLAARGGQAGRRGVRGLAATREGVRAAATGQALGLSPAAGCRTIRSAIQS